MKSWTSFNMGHVGLKSRSLSQILEKPYAPSSGQIFSLILMKLGQNVCLKEISDKFENRSLGHIIEELMLVTKGLRFEILLCNAIPQNP